MACARSGSREDEAVFHNLSGKMYRFLDVGMLLLGSLLGLASPSLAQQIPGAIPGSGSSVVPPSVTAPPTAAPTPHPTSQLPAPSVPEPGDAAPAPAPLLPAREIAYLKETVRESYTQMAATRERLLELLHPRSASAHL